MVVKGTGLVLNVEEILLSEFVSRETRKDKKVEQMR